MNNQQQYIDWLRSTTPDRVVEEAAQMLAEGAPEDVLWAAGTLTAARYLNNQARNLLGFVTHAMIGCEDARQLAKGQPKRTRHLLLIQALYQVSRDLHDPCFAPYQLLPFWPLCEGNTDENIRRLRSDVRFGEYMRCDHRLVALERELPRAELVDLLLDIGLEGMITDDHTLITPALCLSMIELIGWDCGFDMLRCALRYSASFPRDFTPYDRAVGLACNYGLADGASSDRFQPKRVQAIRAAFHAVSPHRRPEVAAHALAEGSSPKTVLAAVSLAACDMYLMVDPTPHADYDAVSREVAPMHIGTSTSVLQAVLSQMSPRTQALAAIQGGSLLERGPSVLNAEFAFVPFTPSRPYPYAEDVAALRNRAPQALLDMLRAALPEHDHRTATAAVHCYAESGASPKPLIATLTEVACTDDGTLLHNFKHLHAMISEFQACSHPDRWKFLIAAARFMSWYAELDTSAYQRAIQALAV
jgi:hypothetical protein